MRRAWPFVLHATNGLGGGLGRIGGAREDPAWVSVPQRRPGGASWDSDNLLFADAMAAGERSAPASFPVRRERRRGSRDLPPRLPRDCRAGMPGTGIFAKRDSDRGTPERTGLLRGPRGGTRASPGRETRGCGRRGPRASTLSMGSPGRDALLGGWTCVVSRDFRAVSQGLRRGRGSSGAAGR